MAKCGCSGQACSCALVAGGGITITGTGSATSPFIISAGLANVAVQDTDTIDMTLTGDGTPTNPYTFSADFIGDIPVPDYTPAESRTWSGAVSLTDVTEPRTIRVTMNGDVSGVTLPTWASSDSGSITLLISQDAIGGRTWVMPGTTASGIDVALSTAASARDLIVMFWTGIQWVVIPSAMNIS